MRRRRITGETCIWWASDVGKFKKRKNAKEDEESENSIRNRTRNQEGKKSPSWYKDWWIQSVDQMFISFVKTLPWSGNIVVPASIFTGPASWERSTGIEYFMGFRVEYGRTTKSPSFISGPGRPNSQKENGEVTSARSNSSGWLQT